MDKIIIKGAREHNLKNIDLEIPRDKLVVITGVSGSGKSTLAFDTIYAEGQRRYVESLSAYARQFLEQMEKPDVESIEGLSPAISIEQKTTSKNPRSTVGTVTEIYDYLRLLFARIGKPYCYKCGKEISAQTIQQMVDRIMELPQDTKMILSSPIVRGRKGEYKKELEQLRKDGYTKIKIDGEVKDLSEDIAVDKKKKHDIDVVIDRLVIKPAIVKRLADSLEVATRLSNGIAKVEIIMEQANRVGAKMATWLPLSKDGNTVASVQKEILFNENLACIDCGISYPELTPAMFSFNSPHGACSECNGLGGKLYFDPDLVVPNKEISLREGAIAPWANKTSIYFHQMIEALSRHFKFDIYTPFKNLPNKIQDMLLYGSGTEEVEFYYEKGDRRHYYKKPFEGVLKNLERRYHETDSSDVMEDLSQYMNTQPCPACNGSRLKKESLFVKIDDHSIYEVTQMSIKESSKFFKGLRLGKTEQEIGRRVLKEIEERLGFLINVGLDYLTLERSAATLSGGEGQRIRLATQIGSSLTGVLYILDEPSIGLHQRDNKRLLDALKRLRDLGNTVLVVEHDEETIVSADYVIDMGPGAGERGGKVVATGTPLEIISNKQSLTGKYLSKELEIPVPSERRKSDGRFLTIKGAKANNLKSITVKIPIGLITCITGVSGSGKSTLVVDTLYRALSQRLYHSKERAGEVEDILGLEFIDKVIDIDQSPIGRTPRSNPATYTGLFMPMRDLFSELPEARMRGYKPGRFSFNVKGGRCEACEGDGLIKVEMHFLPDVYVTCEVCGGKRYNRETLDIKYKGKSIADILDMTVTEALNFFENIPPIKEKLQTLYNVGLGYIRLGQSATTLSGGEAQRIKIAKELSKRATGRTMYILDEPTTGLHFADIQRLLHVLQELRAAGNTILIIEHNLDVLKTADYIIDLGPEGGDEGGRVIATGTPEEVAEVQGSFTGHFLKKVLQGRLKAAVG
ncbi:MAG: excinuclease ABC subunit A [Deltaproteobacteria bacterium GWC2_42_51]|nr:MAG: excinuclease ABC subunit A [Deltaproteobacteria bacterium GWC2_42_51]OGP42840.1 MAG: excinuclease ABC subunit A [Deltaproteobacteria bacterium GWD2_42_10]OGP45696.1 MAG: excinuclease ABC subunit A [Deltaproteobacteria bacterium GWF2_42_12]OGQ27056.1 MAG: excinuclease ABC subunit A [Deltaproteobacteria bacterium RIFCSPHIGHO2_02_FULL_42_44]OGQ38429.1 MAG: excinuclease ABC subunit A [Deltaproteobacteria bacterium RIFCSPLOWO2_02_FULL_42_39]OGQ70314.1 MAG: excinuclease ABC subunit A [Deltap